MPQGGVHDNATARISRSLAFQSQLFESLIPSPQENKDPGTGRLQRGEEDGPLESLTNRRQTPDKPPNSHQRKLNKVSANHLLHLSRNPSSCSHPGLGIRRRMLGPSAPRGGIESRSGGRFDLPTMTDDFPHFHLDYISMNSHLHTKKSDFL
jgi:hypothetical protein